MWFSISRIDDGETSFRIPHGLLTSACKQNVRMSEPQRRQRRGLCYTTARYPQTRGEAKENTSAGEDGRSARMRWSLTTRTIGECNMKVEGEDKGASGVQWTKEILPRGEERRKGGVVLMKCWC